MNRVREALRHAEPESGMSLIEVIVAMVIFAIVSVSVIYGMLGVMSQTRDTRSRAVAANLASQEIDLVRDAADLFALVDKVTPVTLNGDTFTVSRTTQWVSDPGLDLVCGAGGGALKYKRVNVEVTWANMGAGVRPVQSDTVVSPAQKINDPTKGTILVSTLGASGTGVAGITVSATPSTPANGATPLAAAPALTDSQGCTYILKVTPGNYDVTVTKTGYIDENQTVTTSTRTVGVAAGSSASVGFAFDRQGTFNVTYGAGYTAAPGEQVRVPPSITASFGSTHSMTGAFVLTPPATSNLTKSFGLFPFDSGYDVFAGSCLAADPAAWPDLVEGGQTFHGVRSPSVATAPGTAVAAPVPMGVVKLSLGPGSNRYLRAQAVTNPAVSGDPGCPAGPGVVSEHSFGTGSIYAVPSNGNLTVLLPYGSWKLLHGTGAAASSWNTAVTAGQMAPVLPAAPRSTVSVVAGSAVVTFDPRVVVP